MARTGSSMAQHVDLKTVVDGASGLVLSPSYLPGAIAYRLVCAAASLASSSLGCKWHTFEVP